jgi:hypothetical protein
MEIIIAAILGIETFTLPTVELSACHGSFTLLFDLALDFKATAIIFGCLFHQAAKFCSNLSQLKISSKILLHHQIDRND